MKTRRPVGNELRQLLEQSRTFPRSRRELIRTVLLDPDQTIKELVSFADQALDDEGRLVVQILEKSLDAGATAELIELMYRLIPKKSAHFVGLASRLCEGMLMLRRRALPIDRLTESVLLHNLAVHVRDLGDYDRAADISEESVRILRRLTRKNPQQRRRLVNALGIWSKHLSEAGYRRQAIRAARLAVIEAGRLRGKDAVVIRAQTKVALGSCLIVESRSIEALPILRAAKRVLDRLGKISSDHEADLAHVSMFLASAEFSAGANKQARKIAEAAWNIITRIIARDRGTFIEDFIGTADILSLVAASQGDHDRVRQVRGEAGRVLRDLARKYPAQFGFRCIWTWVNWTSHAIQAGDYPAALKLAKGAVREHNAYQRKLRRSDDEVLIVALFNLAVCYYGLKQRQAALQSGHSAELALLRLPDDNERRTDLLPPQVRELLEASSHVPEIRIRTRTVEPSGRPKSGLGRDPLTHRSQRG
ncbi:MAG TPA: hypothetical protein PLX89_07260 [Verrucomicrobiota bacterium]|nr:hypothetical protein [Verrucomicrobiota bacterium]